MKMKIKMLSVALSGALIIFSGCTGSNDPSNEKVVNEQGSTQSAFKEYKENRPESNTQKIGDPRADLVFDSVGKIYGQTVILSDKYISQIENNNVVSKLERLKEEQGIDLYKKEVAALTGDDKKEYDNFMNNQVDKLSVVKTYLIEAIKLQSGLSGLDIKSMISSPFKLPAALKSTKLAAEQTTYTIKALNWLKKNHDVYSEMMNYKGR